MTATQIVQSKAEVGRRIMLTYYRDLDTTPPVEHPGIITGILGKQADAVRIRLDGTRCNLHAPSDYRGIRYLDEVTDVPDLPMGRFIPAESDINGFYLKAGVLVATVGEDGEDLVIITDDQTKAETAATAWAEETGLDPDYVEDLRAQWAVFEWEPEDAESPWTVTWDASKDDDQAVHIYHLPTA